MHSMVSRTTISAGARPELEAISTSFPYRLAKPSAIWLRQQFPMQTKWTFFTACLRITRGRESPWSIRDEKWTPDDVLLRPAPDLPRTWRERGPSDHPHG